MADSYFSRFQGKEVDFLINYEHKVRELESVLLIKIELEKRGYSVALLNNYDIESINFTANVNAKVVLAPALYNDGCLYGFVQRFVGPCKKVVNLQWEQSLSNYDEGNPDFYQNPTGNAKQAVHVCWGEQAQQRIVKYGVPQSKARICGPLHMDTLRDEFKGFYDDKHTIAQSFELDKSKEWILFVSSFTYINMGKEEYDTEVKSMGQRLHDFLSLSIDSKKQILSWLEKAMVAFPEKIFIYRPHPSEKGDLNLEQLEKKYHNFRIIKELSIKQWIAVADRILTWYSTSSAEVYFSNKTCSILRPVEIPHEWEVSIFNNATLIRSEVDFLADIKTPNPVFPIDVDLLRSYYFVDPDKPSYLQLCDLLEEIIRTDKYDLNTSENLSAGEVKRHNLRHRLFFLFKEILVKMNVHKLKLAGKFFGEKLDKHIMLMNRMKNDRKKSQATAQEVHDLTEKLKQFVK